MLSQARRILISELRLAKDLDEDDAEKLLDQVLAEAPAPAEA